MHYIKDKMQIKINCTFFLFDNINSMKLILPQYKTMPYNDKNLNHKSHAFHYQTT